MRNFHQATSQQKQAEQRKSFCRLQLVKNKGFYCLKRQGFIFSPVIQKLSWPLLQFLWLHPTSNQHRLCLKGNEFQLGISKLIFQQDWQVFQSNFLWICRFLGKKLSKFVPPAWKLATTNFLVYKLFDLKKIFKP